MSGKIFYRQRAKIKPGSKTPRFRVVGAADTNLKIYSNHLRKQELEQIARETGCDLVMLEAKSKEKQA